MYQFIKPREEHFQQLIPLLLSTGYYEYAAKNNKLNLSTADFYTLYTLKPFAEYTHILIDNNQPIGFFIASTKAQMKAVEEQIPNEYRDDPILMECIKKIEHFYLHETKETDYISYALAIAPQYQGKGYFKVMKQYRDTLAKANHCNRIIFAVWESNPALNIFKKYGAKILDAMDFTNVPEIQERLLKLELPIDQ